MDKVNFTYLWLLCCRLPDSSPDLLLSSCFVALLLLCSTHSRKYLLLITITTLARHFKEHSRCNYTRCPLYYAYYDEKIKMIKIAELFCILRFTRCFRQSRKLNSCGSTTLINNVCSHIYYQFWLIKSREIHVANYNITIYKC